MARFSDGSRPGAQDVRVRLTDRGIAIEGIGQEVLIWPFGALAVAEPLSQHSIEALVTYSYQPGATLCVPDKAFARALGEHAPHLTMRAHRLRAARPWFWAAGLAGMIAAGIWAAGLSPANAIARMLPDKARHVIGDQALASMTRNRQMCSAPPGLAALDQLTAKLSRAAGTGQRFTVAIVDWDVLNAFATPGERIVMTRALIENAKSPDEVAGVLAHEMGHGIELHPETAIVRGIGLAAATELMLGGFGGTLANVGLMLTQLSYSREAEREADERALAILKAASVSPEGLLAFFDRIAEVEKDEDSGVPGVLQSHPQTEERRARVAAAQTYPAEAALGDAAWAALKAVCSVKAYTRPSEVPDAPAKPLLRSRRLDH